MSANIVNCRQKTELMSKDNFTFMKKLNPAFSELSSFICFKFTIFWTKCLYLVLCALYGSELLSQGPRAWHRQKGGIRLWMSRTEKLWLQASSTGRTPRNLLSSRLGQCCLRPRGAEAASALLQRGSLSELHVMRKINFIFLMLSTNKGGVFQTEHLWNIFSETCMIF